VEKVEKFSELSKLRIRRLTLEIAELEKSITEQELKLALAGLKKDLNHEFLKTEFAKFKKRSLNLSRLKFLWKDFLYLEADPNYLSKRSQFKIDLASFEKEFDEEEIRVDLADLRLRFETMNLGKGDADDYPAMPASKNKLITPSNQGSASSFGKGHNPLAGFGYLPAYSTFVPDLRGVLYKDIDLIPDDDYIKAKTAVIGHSFDVSSESATLDQRGETLEHGFQAQMIAALKKFDYASNGQQQLGTRGFTSGVVTTKSYEDLCLNVNGKLVCAVVELKGGEASSVVALRQAATYGATFVLRLFESGLPRDKCVCYVAGTNGKTIMFGATILLDETFPTMVKLSKELDFSVNAEQNLAFAFFEKSKDLAAFLRKSLSVTCDEKRTVPTEMMLDESKVWVKEYDKATLENGLGLVAPDSLNEDDLEEQFLQGLHHMTQSLNCLYENLKCRDIVEFPLSVRSPVGTDHYRIIYRKLEFWGFIPHIPDRITYPSLFDMFKIALKAAVSECHAAGVTHGDLYASNLLYKTDNAQTPSAVYVKIIDWDVAHRLKEGAFLPLVQKRLRENADLGDFGKARDDRYLSVWDLSVEEGKENLWHDVASPSKKTCDAAFFKLLRSMV